MEEEKKTGAVREEAAGVAAVNSGDNAKAGTVSDGGYFADLDLSAVKVDIEEMFKGGMHFGHHKSRKNPKMEEYIFGTKNGITIIDLEKSAVKLKEALDYIKETVSQNKEILFVGTKKQAKNMVESAATRCQMPYITQRWLGGTFTNFPIISARTRFLRDGLEKMEKGEYARYTKFEQMKIGEELTRLEKRMGGIKNMRVLPAVIFVTSLIEDKLAILEAKKKNIPVIALCDTNTDPTGIDYPIPANDDAVSSLRLVLSYVVKAVDDGKEKAKMAKPAEEKKENK